MNVSEDEIKYEEKIIWLLEPTSMAYVREGTIVSDTRRKPITGRGSTNIIVGYAVLKANAPGRCGLFRRRVFWLSKFDRYYQPKGTYSYGAPAEGVDPISVTPGIAGQITNRSSGTNSMFKQVVELTKRDWEKLSYERFRSLYVWYSWLRQAIA